MLRRIHVKQLLEGTDDYFFKVISEIIYILQYIYIGPRLIQKKSVCRLQTEVKVSDCLTNLNLLHKL